MSGMLRSRRTGRVRQIGAFFVSWMVADKFFKKILKNFENRPK
jgi:hypothetical protein